MDIESKTGRGILGMYRPMMVAAAQALQNTDEWHNRMNEVYARRRELGFPDHGHIGMYL